MENELISLMQEFILETRTSRAKLEQDMEQRIQAEEKRAKAHEARMDKLEEDRGAFRAWCEQQFHEQRTWQQEFSEKMDRKFDEIDRKFAEIDRKFEAVDRRFDEMDQKFIAMDQKFIAMDQKFDEMDQKFVAMDQKFTSKFDQLLQNQDVLALKIDSLSQDVSRLQTDVTGLLLDVSLLKNKNTHKWPTSVSSR